MKTPVEELFELLWDTPNVAVRNINIQPVPLYGL